jgi:hypothetical protein
MVAPSRSAVLAVAVTAAVLSGCGRSHRAATAEPPARVEAVPGSSQAAVHLTAAAARRIGLQTGPVTEQQVPPRSAVVAAPAPPSVAAGPGKPEGDAAKVAPAPPPAKPPPPATTAPPAPATTLRTVLPFAAVLYQPAGDAFVYVAQAGLVFVRQPVVVDYVVGDLAVVTSAPPVGASVVVVGATQLVGAELGVGGEELG